MSEGRLHDRTQWRVRWRVDKYRGDWTPLQIIGGEAGRPYATLEREDNLLTNAGITAIWTALTGGSITAFSSANARIGVGDSATAEAGTQTDLQASTNKVRLAMDPGYPSVSGVELTLAATAPAGTATFDWREWAAFNAAAAGTMLNRKVADSGEKPAGETWRAVAVIWLEN